MTQLEKPDHFVAAIQGTLLGTALGDAIGLPYEGLSPQRAQVLLGKPVRHRFFFARGMVSDDTEHTCMVAQALIASGGDVDKFSRSLAWRFRRWLLLLPAGVGMATARSILKLWVGFSYKNSGVFSAGNGPAMRAAILGVVIQDLHQLQAFTSASTRITHSDPKAEYGALAVALAARQGAKYETIDTALYLSELRSILVGKGTEFMTLIETAVASVENNETTQYFACKMGHEKGVSGYTYHTVPVAIHAWLSHPQDFSAAIIATVECGGDSDTVAAIVGGIVGAAVGVQGLPENWLERLWEWPRTTGWMKALAQQLAQASKSNQAMRPKSANLLLVLMRNVLFLGVVLFHGFRRLLPPYKFIL